MIILNQPFVLAQSSSFGGTLQFHSTVSTSQTVFPVDSELSERLKMPPQVCYRSCQTASSICSTRVVYFRKTNEQEEGRATMLHCSYINVYLLYLMDTIFISSLQPILCISGCGILPTRMWILPQLLRQPLKFHLSWFIPCRICSLVPRLRMIHAFRLIPHFYIQQKFHVEIYARPQILCNTVDKHIRISISKKQTLKQCYYFYMGSPFSLYIYFLY